MLTTIVFKSNDINVNIDKDRFILLCMWFGVTFGREGVWVFVAGPTDSS